MFFFFFFFSKGCFLQNREKSSLCGKNFMKKALENNIRNEENSDDNCIFSLIPTLFSTLLKLGETLRACEQEVASSINGSANNLSES